MNESGKNYKQLDNSPLKEAITSKSFSSFTKSNKKIIPSNAIGGLKETLKKTFLPLLIDVFELRQMIATHQSQKQSPIPIGKVTKPPEKIHQELTAVLQDIQETKRWCEGVELQVTRALDETQEVLNQTLSNKSQNWLKRIFKR